MVQLPVSDKPCSAECDAPSAVLATNQKTSDYFCLTHHPEDWEIIQHFQLPAIHVKDLDDESLGRDFTTGHRELILNFPEWYQIVKVWEQHGQDKMAEAVINLLESRRCGAEHSQTECACTLLQSLILDINKQIGMELEDEETQNPV